MGDKLEVARFYISQNYPVRAVLNLCKIPKSTWYFARSTKACLAPQLARGRPLVNYCYNLQGEEISDEVIKEHLKNFRAKKEFSNEGGCKIISHYFRRDYGLIINHKKVYRLCKELNLLLPKKKKEKKLYRKISENRKVTGPNQLFQFDIKYGYIHGENRHFYLLAFLDVFTKEVVGYHIGRTCTGKDLKITFERILATRNVTQEKLVIRSDNGPQMTSIEFRSFVEEKVHHEFIPPGCPDKNAFIESFFSIFETAFLVPSYFKNFAEAYEKTVEFIKFYNEERLHGAIKKLTPKEFKERYENQDFGIIELSA